MSEYDMIHDMVDIVTYFSSDGSVSYRCYRFPAIPLVNFLMSIRRMPLLFC